MSIGNSPSNNQSPRNILKATHEGPWWVGPIDIQCAVLEDRTRVISRSGLLAALGMHTRTRGRAEQLLDKLPDFMQAQNLKPFVEKHLHCSTNSIRYKPKSRAPVSIGYRAEMIPAICSVYIDAAISGALRSNQTHIARAASDLMSAIGAAGIIALVDSVTDYEKDRKARELEAIFERVLSDELRPWCKIFPDNFFKKLCKLYGWTFKEKGHHTPGCVSHKINELIYDPLSEDIRICLSSRSRGRSGKRSHRFHQHLTDYGRERLRDQILVVTTLLKAARSREWFEFMFQDVMEGHQRGLFEPILPLIDN